MLITATNSLGVNRLVMEVPAPRSFRDAGRRFEMVGG